MSPTNAQRRSTAKYAVDAYMNAHPDYVPGETQDLESAIIDLLADLRHFCKAEGLVFGSMLDMSHEHYLAEQKEEYGHDDQRNY